MGWMEQLGRYVGQAIFDLTFATIAALNKILIEGLWQWVVKPMFHPYQACPDISSGKAGGQGELLEAALQMNRFFLIHWVAPILLVVIIIFGILFMFGWFQNIRQRLKHAAPSVIFAVILAFTTEIWMDVLLDLGRAMLMTVHGAIPQWIAPGWAEMFWVTDTGEGFGEQLAAQFAPVVILSMMTMILILIGVALAVRTAIVYSGIAIMPILTIFLPVPYANKGVKKFIKIWIQAIFFVFFMAIPLVLYKYADGWLQIGFLILTLGMPFLVSTGEVLAMRGAGMPSAGRAATAGVLGGQLSAIAGPGGKVMKKGGKAAGALAGGGAGAAGAAGASEGGGGGGGGGGAASAGGSGGMGGKLSGVGGGLQKAGQVGGPAMLGAPLLKKAAGGAKGNLGKGKGEEPPGEYQQPQGTHDEAMRGSGMKGVDENNKELNQKSLKEIQSRSLAEKNNAKRG